MSILIFRWGIRSRWKKLRNHFECILKDEPRVIGDLNGEKNIMHDRSLASFEDAPLPITDYQKKGGFPE